MKSFPARLTGRLLVARPDLVDPNFVQSIIFLARHDKEGALGFILNRPIGVNLDEATQCELEDRHAFQRIPVLRGGPVGGDRLAVIVFEMTPSGRGIRSLLGLPVERIRRYLDKPNAWVRAFNGYAGWASGQLERELREGSWEIHRADPAAFDPRFARGLWPFLIARDNRWRFLQEFIPPDVERN